MTEPIYLAALRAHARATANRIVRARLGHLVCHCRPLVGEPCRSRSGRPVAPHKGRRLP